jgi:lipopolysaccharide/colanic/teichoic acid biosynthesis glycosyltransferase
MENLKDYNCAKGRADLENYDKSAKSYFEFNQTLIIITVVLLAILITAVVYIFAGPEFYKQWISH